jgi:RNA polymerase sigma-70 factor (ECF subfamily)
MADSVAGLAAFGKVLEEHRPKLLAMLQRRIDQGLGVRLDAEDIFQEACVVAQRRWGEFRELQEQQPDSLAYVWLYGIVRDKLIDNWRTATRGVRDMRREIAWPDHSSEQLGLSLIDTGTGPSSAAAREELKRRVRQVLKLLPDRDYEIVKMRHFDQLTFKQVAQLLRVTENAATVRYVRALKRLKEIWQFLFSNDGDKQ